MPSLRCVALHGFVNCLVMTSGAELSFFGFRINRIVLSPHIAIINQHTSNMSTSTPAPTHGKASTSGAGSESGYRSTAPMNPVIVAPARAEDLQRSYATVVSDQAPEGFYGSMSTWAANQSCCPNDNY